MRKLIYLPLEAYTERYTLQLTDWNTEVFDRRDLDYVIVPGETLDDSKQIVTGQVLDAHGRSYFAMSQMMNLIKMMKNGEVTSDDVILFEDLFHPGIESLPYILDQVSAEFKPKIFVRCLAQSIDPDDFVHVCGMERWMGHYEKLVNEFVDGILASNEEMVAHMRIAGWEAPIYNISGLAFSKNEVQSRVEHIRDFDKRKMRVVFASRWDAEKQPDFYMDIIEQWQKSYPSRHVEFAICSGGKLKSNDASVLERTNKMIDDGKLVVYENLSKNQYYEILANSRVLINTALQDWTSNTISEADALNTNVLVPAYRSFPEIMNNDFERMYITWSVHDVINKLDPLLRKQHINIGKVSNWTSQTVDRIVDIITGNGSEWLRENVFYRKHLREEKY